VIGEEWKQTVDADVRGRSRTDVRRATNCVVLNRDGYSEVRREVAMINQKSGGIRSFEIPDPKVLNFSSTKRLEVKDGPWLVSGKVR
jgi:hypothetical protein